MYGINKTVLGVVGGVILLGGAAYIGYDYGSSKVTTRWQTDTIERQEKDLETAQALNLALETIRAQNEQLDRKVSVEYIDRVRTITETKYANRDVIREVFRDSPYLSRGWVYTHDQLARGLPIDPSKAASKEVSTFTEEDSLRVIGNNYATAQESKQKVDAWINFYDGVQLNYSLPAGTPADSNSTTAGSTRSNQPATTGVRDN